MSASTVLYAGFALGLLGAVLALVADMTGHRRQGGWLAGPPLLIAGAMQLYAGWTIDAEQVANVFVSGGAGSTMPGLVYVLAGLVILAVSDGDESCHSIVPLVALGALGAAVSASAIELVTLLLGVETAAVSAYALVASTGRARASESAAKYFVQGGVATGLFVIGLATLVGLLGGDGSFGFIGARIAEMPQKAAAFGSIAVVAALAFKSGAAPFHSWAPDAYETSGAPAAAFLAGAVKLGMVSALAIFVVMVGPAGASEGAPLGHVGTDLFPLLGGLSLLSIVVGTTVALKTRSVARMLGYAGVAQVGYALISLATVNSSGALFFIATYAVATTAAFLALEAARRITPDWDGTVDDLAGMSTKAPVLSAALTLSLVSLAGLPPLVGFWGKFQVFGAAIVAGGALLRTPGGSGHGTLLIVLTAVGILGSVISLAYYGSVVRALYSPVPDHDREGGASRADQNCGGRGGAAAVVVVVLAVAVLVTGLAPVLLGVSDALWGFLLSR